MALWWVYRRQFQEKVLGERNVIRLQRTPFFSPITRLAKPLTKAEDDVMKQVEQGVVFAVQNSDIESFGYLLLYCFIISLKTFGFGFVFNLHTFKNQLNSFSFGGLFFDPRINYLCASAVFPEIFKFTPIHPYFRSSETFILGLQEKTPSEHGKPSRPKRKGTGAEVYKSTKNLRLSRFSHSMTFSP